ncbi:unnamed protein product [Orchesella dallaii]|uniref:Uncharacterized protein n=1 Tax=Orchesella dallaii TaxID=48710 RepID=A0ABP1QR90_9HEXA
MIPQFFSTDLNFYGIDDRQDTRWGTNSNNIRVGLGNQQLFLENSARNGEWGNPMRLQQQFPTQNYQQPNNYGGHSNSFGGGNYQQTVDTNNYGGTHQNNVGVGGIQNFAGSQDIRERSPGAQLLCRKRLTFISLQVVLNTTEMAANSIKAVINRKRNAISKQQESIQLKYNNYIELAMWLQRRFHRNKYYTTYVKRVKPVEAKSAAAALEFNNFDLKFKAAEQQLADMELANSNHVDRVTNIDLQQVSLETLDVEVAQVKDIVSRATEIKNIFASLQFEGIALKLKVDSHLDDCVSKINALKQEIYIKYGVMHE